MQIIHRFVRCDYCKTEMEVFDEDFIEGHMFCPICGTLLNFLSLETPVYYRTDGEPDDSQTY